MTKTAISLFCGAAAVAILAWACSDDTTSNGGGPLPDAGTTTPSHLPPAPPPSSPDANTDDCKDVDASVPTGSYGDPNANAPADAGGAYTKVPFPSENPYTYEKAILGKLLFWEEQLSSDNTVACGTCHHPAAGGSDPRAETARHPGPDGLMSTLDDIHGSPGIVRCDDSSGT